LPDDPLFEEMDPFIKLWLYEGWLNKEKRHHEALRHQAILIGSFTNPEMANKMVKRENPDHYSTDEEFEQSYEYVKKFNRENPSINTNKHRRKRRQRRIIK